jgi:hypothetical protein
VDSSLDNTTVGERVRIIDGVGVLVINRVYSAPQCIQCAGEAGINNCSPGCYESMTSIVLNLITQITLMRVVSLRLLSVLLAWPKGGPFFLDFEKHGVSGLKVAGW